MEQHTGAPALPKPYRVPRLLPPQEIPGLGLASLQVVVLRTLSEAEMLARQAAEGDKANAFANLILSRMLVDPSRSPEEIDSLPTEAIIALVEVAATSIGSRSEFDALPADLPPRERLYQSHLEAERAQFEILNREITALRKSADASLKSIHDAARATLDAPPLAAFSRDQIDEFVGRTAVINAKLIGDEATAFRAALDKSLFEPLEQSHRLAIDSAMHESLSDAVSAAIRIKPPEPFLSDVLIATGINAPVLHSPTYTLPLVEAVQAPEEIASRAKDAERRRLLDAYDILLHLELNLRELIERKLRELHSHRWWKSGVPDGIRKSCEMRKQEKERPTSRSHHPIAYAYVDDYRAIILKRDNWNQLFVSIFGNSCELETCFTWVGRVRPDIAHARPVSDEDYLYFTTGARWIQDAITRVMDT